MTPAGRDRLERCRIHPGPAAATVHLLRLFERTNVHQPELARAIMGDPALAAALVRLLNAPLFSVRRQADSVQMALSLYGGKTVGDHVLALALSRDLRRSEKFALDGGRFWTRAVVGAVAAVEIGRSLGASALSEVFLVGLLREVGMLALLHALPDAYPALVARHPGRGHALVEREKADFGCSHGDAGLWLFDRWRLPGHLRSLLKATHLSDDRLDASLDERGVRALRVAGPLASALVEAAGGSLAAALQREAEQSLFLGPEALVDLLKRVATASPAIAEVLDVPLRAGDLDGALAATSAAILGAPAPASASPLASLPGSGLRDDPTVPGTILAPAPSPVAPPVPFTGESGLPRRGSPAASSKRLDELLERYRSEYVDPLIARACESAVQEGRALAVLLCEPDDLERVKATHGREVADRLLRALAFEVRGRLRDNDLVARHDRERVFVLLPDVSAEIAPRIAERIRRHVEAFPFELGLAAPISLTISVGCATLAGATRKADLTGEARAEAVLAAADQAIAAAKSRGRNSVASHQSGTRAA